MAFRSSAVSVTNGNGNSGTVPVPAGAATDDIALIFLSVDSGNAQTISWPANFTQLRSTTIATPDGQTYGCAWKRLTGADSGSYTVSWTDSKDYLIQCGLWSGRDTGNPPTDTIATLTSQDGSPISINATGLTAVSGDDLVWVGCPDIVLNNTGISFAPPSTYTERTDVVNGGLSSTGWCNLSFATKDAVGAGATGTVTGTFTSSANAGWVANLVRIPVAPVLAPVPPQPEWPYGKEPVFPMSGRTFVGMPMQQQVVPRPILLGQGVM
jgi:hypothetical protein